MLSALLRADSKHNYSYLLPLHIYPIYKDFRWWEEMEGTL